MELSAEHQQKRRPSDSNTDYMTHKDTGKESDPQAGHKMSDIQATHDRHVFKDLGIPNAEEHLVKAQLVFKIDTIMKDRGLKQAEAADLLGVKQPDVSKMLRGDFRQFSVERLLRFLVALNQDVEIVVKRHRGRSDTAALHVS